MLSSIRGCQLRLRDPWACGGDIYTDPQRFSGPTFARMSRIGESPLMMYITKRHAIQRCDICADMRAGETINFDANLRGGKRQHITPMCACYECIHDLNSCLLSADKSLLYVACGYCAVSVIDVKTYKSTSYSLKLPEIYWVDDQTSSSPAGGIFYSVEDRTNTTHLVRLDVPESNYQLTNLNTVECRNVFMRDNTLCGVIGRGCITFTDLRDDSRPAFVVSTGEHFILRSAAFVSENLFVAASDWAEYMYDIRACERDACVYSFNIDEDYWSIV